MKKMNDAREDQINAVLTREQCSICQLDLEELVSTTCEHIYFKTCITRWLMQSSTCPACRQTLLPEPEEGDESQEGDEPEEDDESEEGDENVLTALWTDHGFVLFDNLEPSNEVERVIFGPPIGPEGRQPLADAAFAACGFDELALGRRPTGFMTFDTDMSVIEVARAAENAKQFLIHRPVKREPHEVYIDWEELDPYVVAMGNSLPAYHRLVSEQATEIPGLSAVCDRRV